MAPTGDGSDDAQLVSCAVEPEESVYLAILRAVAAVDDEPIEELPTLYDTIDPEALGDLLKDDSFSGVVEFVYDSYRIRIDGDQEIEISDRADAS